MPVVTYRVTGPVCKWVIKMEAISLTTLSREEVRFPVYADSNGASVNMAAYTVEAAFLTAAESEAKPSADDWFGASWTYTRTGNWVAACEVGPDSAVGALEQGRYRCWVRITAPGDGEQVVRQVGTISVM